MDRQFVKKERGIVDLTNPFEEDFGFLAVDASELGGVVQQVAVQSSPAISEEFIARIEQKLNELGLKIPAADTRRAELIRIEEKVDKILTMQSQELIAAFGQQEESIRAIIDEVEERKTSLAIDTKEKLKQVENLIIPLLRNLLKNPEKEYILWPNRAEKINKQIDKILEITRQ